MSGVTRTLLRKNRPGRVILPTEITGRDDLLPTTMDEGSVRRSSWAEVKLLVLEVLWLEALKFVTQSVTAGGTIVMVWKEWASSYWSQELIHSVHAA
jgi:hypothetical protein